MKKTVVLGLALTCLLGSSALAITWTKVGDLGYSNPGGNFDRSRIKFNAIAADGAGNVFATCANGNNDTAAGGLSIFPAGGGGRIDVDLNALGYKMEITKMVKGNDGNIYALQNWREINWAYNKGVNRVLKITAAGAVSEVWNAGAASDDNQIQGMDVDNQGRIFWNMNGASNTWKNNYLQMYDPSNPGAGVVNVRPAFNNGWSDQDRMLSLEYTKNGWFSVINSGGASWSQDPISATADRVGGLASNPGWGRTHATATEYDPVHDILWTGALGSTDGSDHNILSRWKNINAATGVAGAQDVWHSPGDVDYGQKYWIAGLGVDTVTGNAYMGYGVGDNVTTIGGWREHVFHYDVNLAMTDDGIPQAGADIAAISYINGNPYVTVMNRTTGLYSLYMPEPTSVVFLALGGLALLRRRTR